MTPRMTGNLKLESEMDFSQALAPQEPVGLAIEDVVVSARGSTSLLGIAIFIIGSIMPTAAAGPAFASASR